jgi:hypothetical protein
VWQLLLDLANSMLLKLLGDHFIVIACHHPMEETVTLFV